jgi:hypothetical protein
MSNMRPCAALAIALFAAPAVQPASAKACLATPVVCRNDDSAESCRQARRQARAQFEVCREQQRQSDARLQADAAKSRKRERDKAAAELRARRDADQLLLNGICRGNSCKGK